MIHNNVLTDFYFLFSLIDIFLFSLVTFLYSLILDSFKRKQNYFQIFIVLRNADPVKKNLSTSSITSAKAGNFITHFTILCETACHVQSPFELRLTELQTHMNLSNKWVQLPALSGSPSVTFKTDGHATPTYMTNSGFKEKSTWQKCKNLSMSLSAILKN